MSIPKIDPYPPAPTPEDDEATFDEKAYEHAASLEPRRVQMNEVATYVNTRASDANSRAVAAAASATASSNSATRSDEWANKAPGSVVASGKYSARHYSDLSDKFANAPEDVEVEPGKFSALHWQEKAKKIADVHATTVATDPLPTVLATNVQEALRDLAYQSDQLRVAKNQLKYGDGPYPVLDFQFQGAKCLDPRIQFTRGSTATYTDAMGNIRTAAVDEPRFTYDPLTGEALGLLLEPSSTNLFTHSRGNGNFLGSIPEFQSNAVDSPVGPQNATLITRCTSTTNRYEVLIPENTYSSGTRLTFRWMQKGINTNRGDGLSLLALRAFVNLTDGIPYKIADLEDGWKHFETHVEVIDGELESRFRAYFGDFGFAGGNPVEDPFAFDGLQLEVGVGTSLIPTEGSQVTRAGDFFSLPIGDWYSPDQGTFLVEGKFLSPEFLASLYEDSDNHILTGRMNILGNSVRESRVVTNGVTVSAEAPGGSLPGDSNIISAISWDGDGFVSSMNGTVSDVVATTYPEPTELRLSVNYRGGWGNTGAVASSVIRRTAYYPRRLTDAQLASLTEVTE